MTTKPFWLKIDESSLRQGDYLPRCFVPTFAPASEKQTDVQDVRVDVFDLIVLTQSCDLENRKARLVAMSPIYHLSTFEKTNPAFANKGKRNDLRRGKIEGLHLLASPTNPDDNMDALLVDFREIYSLPYPYLLQHATQLGSRWRLRSPFLEHFSQTFARFFMRVGLPSSIPEFK